MSTKTHGAEKLTTHNAGVKMGLSDPLHGFIHVQVKNLLRKWLIRDNMGKYFALEGSEKNHTSPIVKSSLNRTT